MIDLLSFYSIQATGRLSSNGIWQCR